MNDFFVTSGKIGEIDISPNVRADNVTVETPIIKGGTIMELIVFTNNGQTYHFEGVENFRPTTTGFTFDYVGVATGVKRSAIFNNTATAGYALRETEV